jgi:hypothetical protein
VSHVRRTQPDVFLTTVAYPIGGTPYYSDVADRITAASPWAESTDRDARIRGRHSRRFYSNADQLLRAEVEFEKLSRSRVPASPLQVQELSRRIAAAREGLHATFADTEA